MDASDTGGKGGRRRAAGIVLLVVTSAVLLFLMFWTPPDPRSEGPKPEPLEPFGIARIGELEFRWAVPADDPPVRVELLEPELTVIWRSREVKGGSYRPDDTEAASLPRGDLLWRPVAVPGDGPERSGDLAVFALVD